METIFQLSTDVIPSLAFIALYCGLFILAKWAKDWFTPYSINEELTHHDNLAVSMTMAGYYVGFTLIYLVLLKGASKGLFTDITNIASYSLVGILMLNLSRWVNDKFILKSFCNIEKLTKEQDIGVGLVQFSVYVATGSIAAGAVSGEGGFVTFAAFFVMGQLALVLFSLLYNLIAPFDIHHELANKNTAAAIAFAGTLVAMGMIIMNGVSGDFEGWLQDIVSFLLSSIIAFVALPILQLLTDRLLIPGKSIKAEIKHDRNLGAGLLEATISVSFAAILINLL